MAITKQNFHEQLKALRVEAGLSQGDLANQLSEGHRVFANVTQSMISLWERGKVMPSMLRRVGIAHFFALDYQYDSSEFAIIERAKRHDLTFEKQNTFYDYPVTSESVVRFSRLTDYQKEWIQCAHAHMLQNTIELDDLMEVLDVNDPWVRIFYHQQAIVSAYVFERKENKITIVSLSAINLTIWKHVHREIAELPATTLFICPVEEGSLRLLFHDLYIEPSLTFNGGEVFKTSIGHLYHNIFVRNMLACDNYDFRLLRYELSKNDIVSFSA